MNEWKLDYGSWICEQDKEDHEQDKAIESWIKNNPQGRDIDFDFKFITSKGTSRNTLVRASISLDQQISEDGTGTFADLIAGSDGRNTYVGEGPGADSVLDAYLYYLNFDEDLSEWLIKMLKSSLALKDLRSETFQIDSEW